MEEAAFCPYWNRQEEHGLDSKYGLAFSEHNDSVRSTICGLTECFIHHHSIPQNIVSGQRTHFTAKEVW